MSVHAEAAHKRWPKQRVISCILGFVTIVGLPSVAFIVFPAKLVQSTEIDPWIYLAYIQDFGATTARFGLTYYGDRIAYIMPEILFRATFGPADGYLVFAFLSLTAASAAVYVIGKRFYGYAAAFSGTAWLCLLPWLPRSIFWTYVDGIAAIYLLIAVALIIVPSRYRHLGHVVAGAVFALAVNCNFLLLAVGLTFAPGWFYLNRTQGIRWILLAGLSIISGFCAAYLGLGVLMHVASNGRLSFFFDIQAARFSMSLLGGKAAAWLVPFKVLLSSPAHYYLLVPPTFLGAVAIIVLRSFNGPLWRQVRLESPLPFFSIMHLALVILLALVLHVYFAVGWLGSYSYSVYFFPGCVLAFICLVGEAAALANSHSKRFLPMVVGGVIVGLLLLPPVWPELLQEHAATRALSTWCCLAGITVCAAAVAGRSAALNSLVVVLIAGSSLAFYSASQYAALTLTTAKIRQTLWDQYDASLFLQRYVNANVPTGTPIRFWYRSRAPETTWLDSAQSTFLWQFTRVASFDSNDPGMPVVNAAFYKNVSGAGSLVLLADKAAELDSGESALRTARVPFKEVKRFKFIGKEVSLYVAIMVPKMSADARLLPLDAFVRASSIGSLQRSADGLEFRSAAIPWSYVAKMPLSAACIHGSSWVAADVQVKRGIVGVGVLNRKGDAFLASGSAGVAEKTQTILLWVDSLSSASDLVLRNWEGEESSEGQLKAVRVAPGSGAGTACPPHGG